MAMRLWSVVVSQDASVVPSSKVVGSRRERKVAGQQGVSHLAFSVCDASDRM